MSAGIPVVVVDDDGALRRAVRRQLERDGLEVLEAASVAEARAVLAGLDGALLLCDIDLPGESGLVLVQELRGRQPEIAVVMVTAVDEPAVGVIRIAPRSAWGERLHRWSALLVKFAAGQSAAQTLNLLAGVVLLRWLPVDEYAQYMLAFTFQSMEKHSAYCAMLRLGLHVPDTILVPYKNPIDNVRWAYTSERYNQPFDLDELADRLGYPLYMKPFDGGGWRGVSRVNDRGDLHRAYDESGEMLMHLQATVDYDHFARALSIGAETMVMDFRPDQPMHNRYAVSHDFLSESAGKQAVAISRIVNAFFRWEFNSAEMLVKGDDVYPIDYANACPDVAVTSLHYYFPWAIKALVKWSVYCVVTGRHGSVDLSTRAYFDVADSDRTYEEKLDAYLDLADAYFETERYADWCSEHLPHLDEAVHEWVTGDDFDRLLRETVQATYPPHEQEQFLAHFRGLVGLWADDQTS